MNYDKKLKEVPEFEFRYTLAPITKGKVKIFKVLFIKTNQFAFIEAESTEEAQLKMFELYRQYRDKYIHNTKEIVSKLFSEDL